MLRTEGDFAALGRVVLEAYQRHPLRILGYCFMGNHWHFVAWPMNRLLCEGPVPRAADWVDWVNEAISPKELDRLELSERRGRPYGREQWVHQTAKGLGLGHTIREEGRPRKMDGKAVV